MSRSGFSHCDIQSEGLVSTRTDSTEPKAEYDGQPDRPEREGPRQFQAKRDDASKDGDGRIEYTNPSPLLDNRDQQISSSARPGTMSIIPLPGFSTMPSSSSAFTTTSTTTRHPRFTGRPRPPPPLPPTTATTTTRKGTDFFASGRPHPGGDRGPKPNNANFFRPHDRNGGSHAPLPAFAIALIVIGAVFIMLAAIATVVCCRGTSLLSSFLWFPCFFAARRWNEDEDNRSQPFMQHRREEESKAAAAAAAAAAGQPNMRRARSAMMMMMTLSRRPQYRCETSRSPRSLSWRGRRGPSPATGRLRLLSLSSTGVSGRLS
ncbi:hypothetical protein PG997_014092 [Apiospora hydei]|uniref:Uncharacterized protein n=1 Tax=Apiospora hydei TaxID=1337664 RepID=A0ABR1V827_9PEZI